tara:strand:- start:480 stop:1721 length:1242 start_codon:yes stop_codon:yes gene_type:complete
MKKLDMNSTATRRAFKAEIDKLYGVGAFTLEQAKSALVSCGEDLKSKWPAIYKIVLKRHCEVEPGLFSFAGNAAVSIEASKVEEKQKTLESDWEVLSEAPVKPKVVANAAPFIINLIPKRDPQYVSWGHFKDIKTVLEKRIFYPLFVTGLSGNGKTSMIREVCAKLKRDFVRVNITVETDEDDLLGGFRLVNGETVWQDGPIIVAMRTGAVALIDEIDLASHKIMCLQPIMEGQPIYLKKINEVVYPKPGFNIVATANTKGKGSEDGRFMGTNILNEAFLDRFSATFYQEYPSAAYEAKILKKQFSVHDIQEDDFVDKLVKWADVIRQSYKEGAVDEIITTRRLIDITKSFVIFGDKMKSVVMCLERFDTETKESFSDLYTKVDAGVSLEDDVESDDTEDAKPIENKDDQVPF